MHSYSIDFKLEVIHYAETISNHSAAKKYKIDRNSIRDWTNKRDKIEELKVKMSGGAKQQRLDGGRRHLTSEGYPLLLEWIFHRRSKGLPVSRKIIMVKAAKFQKEKEKEDPNITKLTFSQGWLETFINKNGLSVRCRRTEAQKSPDQLIDKMCAYILKMKYESKNIFAMDETAVWNDMTSNTTVEKRGAHSQAQAEIKNWPCKQLKNNNSSPLLKITTFFLNQKDKSKCLRKLVSPEAVNY